jgi:hypothetical protein
LYRQQWAARGRPRVADLVVGVERWKLPGQQQQRRCHRGRAQKPGAQQRYLYWGSSPNELLTTRTLVDHHQQK